MGRAARGAKHPVIDLDLACEMARSFSLSCAVPCRIMGADGVVLFDTASGETLCAQCEARFACGERCRALHRDGAKQSERFGGRYIYACPLGMEWIAAPVLLGGQIVCALFCGPILIMELEDYLAGAPLLQAQLFSAPPEDLEGFLGRFPRRAPDDLSHLSELLLALALYIGDSSLVLLEKRDQEAQYGSIGTSIQQHKRTGVPTLYPLETENALIRAIMEGDEADARRLLNELLGYIFFSTGSDFPFIRTRSIELMAVLSRAAAEGGADLARVLALNETFLRESDRLRSTDDLVTWLTKLITCYTGLVFENIRIKRKDVILRAVHYMKRRMSERVTLADTARQAGLSPTYFSRVFKEEMGCTFTYYLNRLRVERSKALLLSGKATLQETCDAVGFGDQSYFIKVFCTYTGVTPGAYRKKQGRLDHAKEWDASDASENNQKNGRQETR